MYRAMTAPVLEPVGDSKVALQSVNVEAVIENLLCQVNMRQVYRNLENINIEAVYTFPLPLGAVLLDMTITTKARKLKGVVVEKKEAAEIYEDAITDGDTAIMLEKIEDGLYTMNVGNLQPEDEIEISITYAELLKWQDNSLRLFLPTTVAPRYGDPESLGIEPHQTPEYDLIADNQFNIAVTVLGELAKASFNSPSHQLNIKKQIGKTIISLHKDKAFMDKDFVLNFLMNNERKYLATVDKDYDDYVALASFYPKFPLFKAKPPRCITIIVDCSGSMQGDSISQARIALYEILELLRPEDSFNLIRFGSSFKKLFPTPLKAINSNLKKAKNILEVLHADMGGTEIGQAIAAAIESKEPSELSKEILLITDGEVWDWKSVTAEVKKSDYRFFTVGVGSAVSEAFIKTLADVTGGACELVSPREDMAEKIVRHFKRIYYPKAENIEIKWSCKPYKVFPEKRIESLYDGDTLHVFGRFKKKPDGDITLTARLENGETLRQKLPLIMTSLSDTVSDLPGTIARMAAAREVNSLDNEKAATNIAVKYQLLSQYTNYLAIDVKEKNLKAENLPVLRKTPQMLAAGWGGTGAVNCDSLICQESYSVGSYKDFDSIAKLNGFEEEQIPLFSRRLKDFNESSSLSAHIEKIDMAHTNANVLAALSLHDLKSLGLQNDILIELRKLNVSENIIVVVFLYVLSHNKSFEKTSSRHLKRLTSKAYKQLPNFDKAILKIIEDIVYENVNEDSIIF